RARARRPARGAPAASLTWRTRISANSPIPVLGMSSTPWNSCGRGDPRVLERLDRLAHGRLGELGLHAAADERFRLDPLHVLPRQFGARLGEGLVQAHLRAGDGAVRYAQACQLG